MKIHELLEHHGISRNPFAEEDAQTDPVFKEHCITTTYHASWDKVFGDPGEPSTAVVFGEKGSGKTALRLQIASHLDQFNRDHPEERNFVIHYVDFNHVLDRFRDHLSRRQRRNVDRVLAHWKLWDHMDAVLTLGVTELVDEILGVDDKRPSGANPVQLSDIQSFDRSDARDLLLLAACYDESTSGTFKGRWQRLRQVCKFNILLSHLDFAAAWVWSVLVITAAVYAYSVGWTVALHWTAVFGAIGLAGWIPWIARLVKSAARARRIGHHLRVGNRESGALRKVLMQFRNSELAGQPLPDRKRTDDRYELLLKFQRVIGKLGFTGLVVLVDRLDEPHLIHSAPKLMKALLWPLLDNKFLKHEGLGLKLMLPAELRSYVEQENRDFHERARLDKQNLIMSFEWSGESLYDLAQTRLLACAEPGQQVALTDLFDSQTSQQRLVEAFRSLRVPRRLFKFLYRLLSEHCNAHTSQQPAWQIPAALFETTLAVFLREQEAFDRGVGVG